MRLLTQAVLGCRIPAVALACATAAAIPLSVQPATAQPAPPVPNLSVAEKDLADARKYFILHKPGVTVEQARVDLEFCWHFLPHGMPRPVPGFVPWTRSQAIRQAPGGPGPYGLVGDIMAAMVAGPLERSMRQSRIFRCMVPRGYDRYRTSEAIWKQLNEGDANASIAMQARIAAGPVPPTQRILP
jgi:hypothetical protein